MSDATETLKAQLDRYKYGILLIAGVAGAAFLEAKWLPGVASTVVIGFLAAASAAEAAALVKSAGGDAFPKVSLTLAIAAVFVVIFPRLEEGLAGTHSAAAFYRFSPAELGLLAFLFFAAACVLRRKVEGAPQTLGLGAVVIAVPVSLCYLIELRYYNTEPSWDGFELLIFTVAVAKLGDVAAYIVGSAIGKHKLIPEVSPGKTWEGSGASLVAASGLGGILAALRFCGPLTAAQAVYAAIVINVASQFGDLAESLLKRAAGAKDSGRWLPQFGGAFDMVDSFFLSAPLFYCFLKVVVY